MFSDDVQDTYADLGDMIMKKILPCTESNCPLLWKRAIIKR